MAKTDKTWIVTGYPDGRNREPVCRFYEYSLDQYVNEYTPTDFLKKCFVFIAKKRSASEKSVLYVKYDGEEETNIKYHLISFKDRKYTARTYKFAKGDNGGLKENCITEKVLITTDDEDIAKYELRDFRVDET